MKVQLCLNIVVSILLLGCGTHTCRGQKNTSTSIFDGIIKRNIEANTLEKSVDYVEIQFFVPYFDISIIYFNINKDGNIKIPYYFDCPENHILDLRRDFGVTHSAIDSIYRYVNSIFIEKTAPIYSRIEPLPYCSACDSPAITVNVYKKGRKILARDIQIQENEFERRVFFSDEFKYLYRYLFTFARECNRKYGPADGKWKEYGFPREVWLTPSGLIKQRAGSGSRRK